MKSLRAILFDLDGVIIDSEKLWDRGQEIFFAGRGLPYERERLKHRMSGQSILAGAVVMKEAYALPETPEEIAQERVKIIRTLFQNEISYVQGFEAFFAEVRNGFKTCVATAMEISLLGMVDAKLGLRRRFSGHVYSVADVGNVGKPAPDLFLHAAAKLATAPKECIVIEDSPNGIEAARRAGMGCIALTTTYRRDLLGGADQIVDSFEEIELA
ncbi:MAG: HAD family phosphatase [Nitrospirae bacterium]|nr:HAD family phosphatase [Nitrospirota bacterium]